MRDIIFKLEVPSKDLLEHVALVCTVEWELAVEHGIKDHSRAPGVNLGSIVGLVLKDLGCGVVWRPTGSCQASPVLHHVAQAKVADLKILICVKEQIF